MRHYITARVFRFDPTTDKEPYFKTYKIRTDDRVSVLVLLDQIYKEVDHTLSFRSYCCGLQMCRSCLMKINRRNALACLTLVKPGDEVLIEPISYPQQHIKDLVVKIGE